MSLLAGLSSPDASALPGEATLRHRMTIAAAIAGAAFVGFGLIMWIAANWDDLGRMQKFGLVGGAFGLACLAAMAHRALRIPGALVAFCAIGGLFALFGQVYQSGSDPWTLFALWAALGLPLAIAARHDAVWLPWTVVAFTAIPLWTVTVSGSDWAVPSAIALGVWLAGAAITAALWLLNHRTSGESHWSFRLAAISTIGLITSIALPAIFAGSMRGDVVLGGLLALGGIIAVMAMLTPMEFGVMAVAGMAIDAMLISLLVKLVAVDTRSFEPVSFLLIGLLSAAIVAASAAALLKLLRQRSPAQPESDDPQTPALAGAPGQRISTWPVTVMSGFGALLAAIPCLFFYALAFKDLLRDGAGIYALGLATIAGGLAIMRFSKPLGFGQQFGFIALVVGLLLFSGGIIRDTSFRNAALGLFLLLTALAVVISVGWVQSLFGAAAASALTVFLSSTTGRAGFASELKFTSFSWITVAALAAMLLVLLGPVYRSAETGRLRAGLERYAQGFAASAILGLIGSAGQTFLLGAASGLPMPTSGAAILAGWTPGRIVSLVLALAGSGLLLWRERALRLPAMFVILAVLLVLSAITNNLGAAVLIGAIAFTFGHRVLAGFAFIACLWIIGTLYYWLGWSLTQKAWLMIGLGAILGLAAVLSGLRRDATAPMPQVAGWPATMAALLVGLSGAATAGIVGKGVMDKEAILSSGRSVYIALAPVDPRSLMQGDYMALRFALPTLGKLEDSKDPPQVVAKVDARRIATVTRLAGAQPALAADEMRLTLKRRRGAWILGTDAWYFREGKAKVFEAAKFGEFRVAADGETMLVGMTDQNLSPLR